MKPKGDIILVTGSNGRIGTAVMRRLSEQFDNIVGFDQKAPDPAPSGCTRIAVDITSDESVVAGFDVLREHHGQRIAAVIHLAAYYDFIGKPNPKYDEVTVAGTRRLLQRLRKDFEVQQFVFSSTMLVHQPGEPGIFINEDSPIGPTWAYPESKVKTEAVIKAEHGDIATVILRFAGVYDDGCHLPSLANQIERIYERQLESHLYAGETSHGQALVHMDDAVDAIQRTVERRETLPADTVILIGEPEAINYDELQHTLLRLIHDESYETYNVPAFVAKAGAWAEDHVLGQKPFIKPWMIDRANDHYALDITRARKLLDWAPDRSLRETLPKMVAKLKSDPLTFYRENGLEPPASLTDKPDPDLAAAVKPASGAAQAPHDHGGNSAGGHSGMMLEAHRNMLWPHYLNIMLGIWLVTSPFTLGYLSDYIPDENAMRVMADRGLSEFSHRNLAMLVSDVISGILVIIFGFLAANSSRRYPWAQWALAVVGGWLLFAPLIFWTPLPEAYANDTLVGGMVIALSVLIPMMPGMSMEGMMGKPDIPPGWAYNPASWLQRAPIAVLALTGFFIARYMTAYQLGHVDGQWEPFFAGAGGLNGTETIITSSVSKAWPIADGGLGAVVYMLELVMTFMGGRTRWRTMPWMVLALALLIVPLGVISIYFIIIQPIVIGTWCTICLIAALAMALMIPFSLDEFVAMGQFLLDSRRKGKPFWRTFWTGGAMEGGGDDDSKGLVATRREAFGQAARGVTFPWTLLLSIAIGVWLTFSRVSFGNSGAMANSDHLIGALVITFSIIAFAEVGRAVRFINILFGAWLILAPWLLDGIGSPLAAWSGAISGVLLIAFAIPRGRIRNPYAGWSRYVV